MSTSFLTADRNTHVKIVVVALVAAGVVAAVAFKARAPEPGPMAAHSRSDGLVVKAGQPARYSIRDEAAIR